MHKTVHWSIILHHILYIFSVFLIEMFLRTFINLKSFHFETLNHANVERLVSGVQFHVKNSSFVH